MNDPKKKSNQCKAECIDAELVFCAGLNYEMGFCCDPEVEKRCPRGSTTLDPLYNTPQNWCSDRNPSAPAVYNYLVCPNEATCGDGGKKFITPEMTGEVLTRDIERYSKDNKFVLGDICSWIIRAPVEMGFRDIMWLKVSHVTQSDVFVSIGKDFTYRGRLPVDVPSSGGKKFGVLKGKEFYVVGVANTIFNGWFRIETYIEKWKPPPPSPKP